MQYIYSSASMKCFQATGEGPPPQKKRQHQEFHNMKFINLFLSCESFYPSGSGSETLLVDLRPNPKSPTGG